MSRPSGSDEWRTRVFAEPSGSHHLDDLDPSRPITRPLGWLALLGLGLLVASQFVSWGKATDSFGQVWALGVRAQSFDGFPALMAAAGLCLLLLSKSAAGSQTSVFGWLPSILGITALFLSVNALRDVADEVRQSWHPSNAEIGIGVWMTLAGGAASGLSGTAITVRLVRHQIVGRIKAIDPETLNTGRKLGALGAIAGAAVGIMASVASSLDLIQSGFVAMLGLVVGPIAVVYPWLWVRRGREKVERLRREGPYR